jgi:hypothetical protein
MPLAHLNAPFEHPDWMFEPKMDGFRAVAYVEAAVADWYRATEMCIQGNSATSVV